ncbi:hypothetical protein [Chroococcus sp. FPU101]|uniref:hypothetical protein n=1 Tax=Chroococcus sp. FPU101 TaxID=1974212 RepID=UPI001A8C93AF|nr:hypothetical protein [Chroococcus sp. FPU101]GFE71096.1 hypothetical protein CFPU101_37060 [Chroococcus sp. FPU101]
MTAEIVEESILPDITKGTLILSQLYEIGDEINLSRASALIAQPTARRPMSIHVRQAESIQFAEYPVQIELGEYPIVLAGYSFLGMLRVRIYDLGAIAFSLVLPFPTPANWMMIAQLMAMAQSLPDNIEDLFIKNLEDIEKVIYPSISKPHRSSVVEDYSILIVQQLTQTIKVSSLAEHPIVWAALLGEQQPLSDSAKQLITQMSYYPDDMALLSWNGALLIEPDPLAAQTAIVLIEFANVELLLMRSYDNALDELLPRMYRQLPKEPIRFGLPLVSRYSRLLHDVQRLIAEFSEDTERVDNALKVTNDVYWNRFYSSILNVLRVDVWRSGVEHKLKLLRETYEMLHDEADTERATALEWTVIILIAWEVVWALVRHN